MSNAYTPGPWKADGNGVHKGMRCVALTYMAPKEQRDADARLIAAAPDLLDALILMVRTHDEPAESSLQMAKEQQWLEKARAVIAKATGEIA